MADVRIHLPRQSAADPLLYTPAALCAAKFLLYVRGVPYSEIAVETPGGEILFLADRDSCYTVLNKFAVLRDEEITLLGVKIDTHILGSPLGKLRVFKVSSACDFAPELLRESAVSPMGEELVGSIVYDENRTVAYHFLKRQGDLSVLIAALGAASCIRKNSVSLTVGDHILDFSYHDGRFRVSDRGRAPLVFFAPAID